MSTGQFQDALTAAIRSADAYSEAQKQRKHSQKLARESRDLIETSRQLIGTSKKRKAKHHTA